MPKRARRGQTAKGVLASDDPDDDDISQLTIEPDFAKYKSGTNILDDAG